MVSKIIFPTFQSWTRDFASRVGLYPELLAKEFATELAKADLTQQQIDAGLNQFKKQAADNPWMPNPAEFVEMCRDAENSGVTGTREAYQEACKNAGFIMEANWSHPAVYVAGKATGWFELRNKAEKDTWPIFKLAYKEALARAAKGEDLSVFVPKAQIEHRDIFKAAVDNPDRLRVMRMLGKTGK